MLTAQFLHLPLGVPQIAVPVAFTLVLLAGAVVPGAIGVYEGGIAGCIGLLG